jgi:hypothetical protein
VDCELNIDNLQSAICNYAMSWAAPITNHVQRLVQ